MPYGVSTGFSDEERRLRVRMAEMGTNQRGVAKALGLNWQDVSPVIRGTSKKPRYVAEVYKYLGLEQPLKTESTA